MDVTLIQSSTFDLPSSQRVGAIVHDGTTDMRLWPGAGPDRDLSGTFGDELNSVLDREKEKLEDGQLAIGDMVRLHRGKLHCDFLLWIATRPPETAGVRADAPAEEIIRKGVMDALAFVTERSVTRVAFRTLGEGPNSISDIDRMVLIAQTAAAFYDAIAAKGEQLVVEEVLICHPHSTKITAARKKLGKAVKAELAPKKAKSKAKTTVKKPRASSRKKVIILSEEEIAAAKASAQAYDRAVTYMAGDFFLHTKFGAGRVEELTLDGFIMVLFEAGETRRMLHARG